MLRTIISFMFMEVSENDPFLLDEVETARCVELCRAYLIEEAPATEELAMAWIAVAGETLQERQGPDSIGKFWLEKLLEIPICFPFLN